MQAWLPMSLAAVALVALIWLVHGLWRRRRLLRRLELALRDVPRDPATGLYDRRVCLQRIAAELKRAARTHGSVWVGIVTVVDGDANRFGRILADSLRVPEVAFRLSERVVCIARPDLDPANRSDLLGRIATAGPREHLAIGETIWDGVADGDAADVLRAASADVREGVAP